MITDQNAVLTSRGPLIIRVQRDAPKYRGVVALSEGDGTRERPLYFVLLGCHADMADEAPAEVVYGRTRTLAEAVLTRLQRGEVRDVLHSLNAAAVATGRYFSVAAGRLTERNVSVVALGDVAATVASGDTWTSVLTPNVVRVGEQTILEASFGIGFKEEAVQSKGLALTDGRLLLIAVGGCDQASIANVVRHQSAETLIEDVVSAGRVPPPIVAVVG